jgi:phosphatidylglycerophosphatase A
MKIKKFILSCFGLGFLPFAPGTWGSLPAVAILLIVYHFWPDEVVCGTVIVAAMAASIAFCLLFAGEAAKQEEKKDPRWIVIDEFAGQCVAILPVAVTGERVLTATIASFMLFRIFDILKPSPVRECELLKGGLGILADDIVAGLMAGVTVQIVSYLFTFFR